MSQTSPTQPNAFPSGGQLSPRSAKRPRPDTAGSGGAGGNDNSMFQHEAPDEDGGDDDDDEEETGGGRAKKAGRRKIKIEFIQDKSRRHITFSKRKAGIMKKAYELSTLTGTQVLLLVVSETGLVYTFTTAKLQPLVTQPEGKNLIQACLNAPNGAPPQSGGTAGSGGESDSSPTMHNRKPPVGIGLGDGSANSAGGGGGGGSSVVMGGGADTRPNKARKMTGSDAPGTAGSDSTAPTTSPRSPTAPRPPNPAPYGMYGGGYPAPGQSGGSGNQSSPPTSATNPQPPMGIPGGMGSYPYQTSPTTLYNTYPPGLYGNPQAGPPQNAATMPRAASAQGRQNTAGSVGAGVGGVGSTSLSGWNSTGGQRGR